MKNTILQNFDPKRFDYFHKLFFSNFLGAQIGKNEGQKYVLLTSQTCFLMLLSCCYFYQ